tara:strand:- start:1132 stop:2340 length:1209 start_codon:yes stop_codon:yes gene_type:complete
MICIDSKKTVEILLSNINTLRERWHGKEDQIHKKPFELYRENHLRKSIYAVNFKDTDFNCNKRLNILFSHFPLTKYEMESIEMPLYASRVFPNSNIDSVYFDSRGRIANSNTHYLSSMVGGNISIPRDKDDFRESYDLMITKSSTITTMKRSIPKILESCKYKVNIQTNNYAPNLDVGEDYRFCYTDFFAPAGRKFTDRAQSLISEDGFGKMNLVIMTGTVVWWKGQVEWIENIDPELLKDKVVLVFGGVGHDTGYFHRLIQAAQRKNISLLYSEYVNPDFLCDVLCFTRIKIMNHYADPGDGQPAIGPARTFGEAISCNNICVHGQTYTTENKEIGKTAFIPKEWEKFTIEYDQSSSQAMNDAFDASLSHDASFLDFENSISLEEKCDQIFEKCLEKSGIT